MITGLCPLVSVFVLAQSAGLLRGGSAARVCAGVPPRHGAGRPVDRQRHRAAADRPGGAVCDLSRGLGQDRGGREKTQPGQIGNN
ncbi:hypothetical protein KL920_000675 [Ogataea angusta]|nr:hypothetical protein KL920_000675 [Ogataea angusta]KAG7837099.1 hypothetical protein KL943_001138 [Ogataea angusta]